MRVFCVIDDTLSGLTTVCFMRGILSTRVDILEFCAPECTFSIVATTRSYAGAVAFPLSEQSHQCQRAYKTAVNATITKVLTAIYTYQHLIINQRKKDNILMLIMLYGHTTKILTTGLKFAIIYIC